MNKHNWLFGMLISLAVQLEAQTLIPDLHDKTLWNTVSRSTEPINEGVRKSILFNEGEGEGFLMLKGVEFSNGTIEFDVKGKDVVQQSFVGVVFHDQIERTFDVVYFRPFNFNNPDSSRRAHAVQYISMSDHPWEKLRETFPGKYEKSIKPAPDADA